jgi:hypothetical protein
MSQDIKVESLLPFTINRKDAKKRFKVWVSSRWFAPNAFKKYLNDNKILFGYYIPHWTYDSDTVTDYNGERGEYYYVTVTKTVTEDGKSREVEVEERRTEWYYVSGQVRVDFDDITVVASPTIPNKILDALEPWDTTKLVPFDDKYISGFDTQEYTTNLKDGFSVAKDKMTSKINSAIRNDIGGDEQRINSTDTRYNNTTYKNTLFPVWSATFKWNKKEYEYAINAQTGEVVGDRPYSIVKIALTVISIATIIGLIVYYNR